MEEKLNKDLIVGNIKFDKEWVFPSPNQNKSNKLRVPQQTFINEYYPSGHKIYDKSIYPDKELLIEVKEKGKPVRTELKRVEVKRVALAIQNLSIGVIMPHLLGNDIIHKQLVFDKKSKNDDKLALYKRLWEYKNTYKDLWDFIEHSLICAESAIYFYFDSKRKLKSKVLSLLNGDKLHPVFDLSGNLEVLYRKYTVINADNEKETRIDKIESGKVSTYDENGDIINSSIIGFPFIPVVYHKRQEGAFWTKVQDSIDALEINISALAEDNRTKSKGKYHIKVSNPEQVQSKTIGGADVIVTDANGDFKLINPSSMSEAFKYEYDTLKENIFDPLGIVFLKMKSSGDMPTGSMKLLFYPSERVCKQLIKEYSTSVQEISDLFRTGIAIEYSNLGLNDSDFIVQSNIQLFVPSDDLATLTATADALSKGGMTFEAVVRSNPKFLEGTDIEIKKTEAKEKARIESEAIKATKSSLDTETDIETETENTKE